MSDNYRPDLSPYGVVIPKPPGPPDEEALGTALGNASKPLPGATALRLYLEQQTREAASEAIRRGLDRPLTHWDPA